MTTFVSIVTIMGVKKLVLDRPVDTQEILKRYISKDLLNSRLEIEADDDLLGDNLIDSLLLLRISLQLMYL